MFGGICRKYAGLRTGIGLLRPRVGSSIIKSTESVRFRSLTTPISRPPTGAVYRTTLNSRSYATSSRPTKKEPKVRYLFYMFVLSSFTVFIAGQVVNKKKPKTSFGSEQELDEYEQATGLKRRSRLINDANGEKYKFYAIPYYEDESIVNKVKLALGEGAKIKEIDVDDLITRELNDDTRKYCFLLQDLNKRKKPYPNGLITALIRNEVHFYINTSQGIYDTNFILKNYPRNTQEASKFETDVALLEKIIVTKNDINETLPAKLSDDQVRKITNVVSYFETVGKSTILNSLDDELNL